jgi:tRNA U38,U39,U40 pseudouridine synthase TruA
MKDGEIKVFCVIEVSNRFNSKNQTSHRDYSYYLPTFLLAPIPEFFLGKLGTSLKPEEQVLRDEDITAQRVVNGITITKRLTNEADQRDGCESFMERDIKHLTANPQFLTRLYGYRLPAEQKEKLHKTFKDTFEGTRKYHNYTRDMDPSKNAAKRYMLELTANDYMYVNHKTFEVTDAADPDALEFVHFFLKGQSFLYN